jgi:hypothetical protein
LQVRIAFFFGFLFLTIKFYKLFDRINILTLTIKMGLKEVLQNHKNTIVVLLSIIVIYYVIVLRCNGSIYNELMTGFWKADGEFLKDAGLTSFLLYLAPTDWKGIRACYLLAVNGDELVINEPCSVSLNQTWKLGNWSTGFGVKTYDIIFKDLETDDIPNKLILNFYPKTGKIILSKGDVIYGIFYRDAYLTDTMNQVDIINPEAEKIADNEVDSI